MKRINALLLAALLFAGCSPRETTLGFSVQGNAVPVLSIQDAAVGSPVVLSGTMTKKCPVAGCWFTLRDQTGNIKVDTKDSGFVVVDVPLNSKVTVAGHVVTNGTERLIAARGVRY